MYTFPLVSSVPYLLTKSQIIQNAKLYLLIVNVGFVYFVPLSTSTRELSAGLLPERPRHALKSAYEVRTTSGISQPRPRRSVRYLHDLVTWWSGCSVIKCHGINIVSTGTVLLALKLEVLQ